MVLRGLSRRMGMITAQLALVVGGLASEARTLEAASRGGALAPSANERRAVRGRPAPEPVNADDAAALRAFEATLPEELPPLVRPETRPTPVSAAPGLGGQWNGTGDEAAADGPGPLGRGGPLAALYLDFLGTDPAGRALVATWAERLATWQTACAGVLEAGGVPPWVLSAAVVASGFDREARGRAGEAGPWLLRAETARAEGLRIGFWQDERRDPVRATEAAVGALRALQAQLGSWSRALVAFHLGEAGGERADAEAPLSRSARLFLAKVAAVNEVLARVDRSAAAERAFAVIEVPGAITLETVARVTGANLEAVRALNPGLLRNRAAPFGGTPLVRVPAAVKSPGLPAFEAARAPADRVQIESLRLGESAEAKASTRAIPFAEVKRLHGVKDGSELRGPMELLLPIVPPGAPVATAPGSDDVVEEPPLVAVPARRFDLPDRVRAFYFVVDGDTLEEIASAAELTPAEIVDWNNLNPAARLQPKMVLQLFVKPTLDRTRIALVDAGGVRAVEVGSEEFHALEVARRGKTRIVYEAKPGDTLAKIGRRYGLGAADLARINRMSFASELTAGQRIVVYAPSSGEARQVGREAAVGRSLPPPKRRDDKVQGPVRKVPTPAKRAQVTPGKPARSGSTPTRR
jgi:membrane-bound lytic murein transglycosylase D